MKTTYLALALSLFSNAAFASNTYELSIDLRESNGKRISQDLDVTEWLENFPNSADPRGTISKEIMITGEALVKVGYYRGSSEANAAKLGHRLNIFDLSVRTPDGRESYCYNSFYVQDLRETPYIHQTCPIANGKDIIVDFSSKKFWQ